MAVALVQTVKNTIFGTPSLTVTLPVASTPGNLLVISVMHQSTGVMNNATDAAGNVWNLAADSTVNGSTSQYKTGIYYSMTTKATTSVTVSHGGSGSALGVVVAEYSGVQAFRAAASASNNTENQTVHTNAPVAANAGDLVVSAATFYSNSDNATVASPYVLTGLTGVSTSRLGAAWSASTPTGNTTATWTFVPAGAAFYGHGFVTASFTAKTATEATSFLMDNGTLIPITFTTK